MISKLKMTQQLDTQPSPMMAQWHACKKEAQDALLFFRLGDFYEAFYEDAHIISKALNVTLTARQGIAMCGVPFHASDNYIDKLVAKGYKVAIAEQIENPKAAKGLIKREIHRIITPGTVVSSQLLSEKRNNFFASVSKIGEHFGLSYLDLTTGEFYTTELDEERFLLDELHRLRPAEFLASSQFIETHPLFFEELSHAFPFVLNQRQGTDPRIAADALALHFDVSNLDGFGLRSRAAAVSAAGMLLLHLKEDLNLGLEQITTIQTESPSQFMAIDRMTLRHLELIESGIDAKNTLLEFLDVTATPMGGRLLASWLKRPLLLCPAIERRQNAIAGFLFFPDLANEVRFILEQVRDIERLTMKLASRIAGPRDLYAIGASLSHFPRLKETLLSIDSPEIQADAKVIFDAAPLSSQILSAMNDSPPLRIGEGEIFKDNFHPQLDRLRSLAKDSISWMARYQTQLREESGIKTLKVGYTRAFGYYIEVSKAQAGKVPSSFERRQTLVNGERFITDELKQFEHQVLSAEEQSRALEAQQFEILRSSLAKEACRLSSASKAIARIDVLLSLAKIAKRDRFCRPVVDTTDVLEIEEGRHPIVEKSIGSASFIPNDTLLNSERQMMLITGPNMAGKSTYIRQVALIAILAQMGSYVPAKSARIGVIDQVFSRIGASDDLSRGHSTFMVEMSETANILNHATERSLVLLDEIGRGTSTYDGVSIAWAVAEFLLTTKKSAAKTLFATHYWELTQLETEFPHAMNYQTSVQETSSGIVFLKKIIQGGTDKSYGIHVAKLAGLPMKTIRRAEEILARFEKNTPRKKIAEYKQLSFFAPPIDPILEELKSLDLNQLTPLQALQKLTQWQKNT
ncbi:MAG TPA: DNA mismatch repair protein MutS [Chlamydiales bacterium]|nr:DNA mismatch repair protein MutS [Chlamydiales bacterium]